jgi:hypothetical protein
LTLRYAPPQAIPETPTTYAFRRLWGCGFTSLIGAKLAERRAMLYRTPNSLQNLASGPSRSGKLRRDPGSTLIVAPSTIRV